MNRKFVPHHSHWGAFNAVVEDGKVVGAVPFDFDPDPSPLIEAIPDSVYSPLRISRPMIRSGWLKDGRASGESRGREPFVPVSWERALELVAGELGRVRREHGPSAIMGGSQGWSSAGHFHEARGQLRRFLAASGGFVDQTSNYSFGTALTFLPHILGSAQAVTGPLTSWTSIARHTRLFVMFGGANPKNTQVAKGGCARHGTSGALAALATAGVRVINVSPIREDGPEAVRPEWIPIRPNTDTAMLLALAHTLIVERRHGEGFLARYCNGFERVLPYLAGETDGQPKDAGWAASITGVPAETIRDLARQMADTRTMLTASWSLAARRPWRAALLGAGVVGGVPRSDWIAGRRIWLWLRLRRQPGRAAEPVPRPGDAGSAQPGRIVDPGRAHRGLSAQSRSALRLRRQKRGLSRYPTRLLGRRQSVPPPPGPEPVAPRMAAPRDDHCARAVVDGDGAACRYRAAGDDLART